MEISPGMEALTKETFLEVFCHLGNGDVHKQGYSQSFVDCAAEKIFSAQGVLPIVPKGVDSTQTMPLRLKFSDPNNPESVRQELLHLKEENFPDLEFMVVAGDLLEYALYEKLKKRQWAVLHL